MKTSRRRKRICKALQERKREKAQLFEGEKRRDNYKVNEKSNRIKNPRVNNCEVVSKGIKYRKPTSSLKKGTHLSSLSLSRIYWCKFSSPWLYVFIPGMRLMDSRFKEIKDYEMMGVFFPHSFTILLIKTKKKRCFIIFYNLFCGHQTIDN